MTDDQLTDHGRIRTAVEVIKRYPVLIITLLLVEVAAWPIGVWLTDQYATTPIHGFRIGAVFGAVLVGSLYVLVSGFTWYIVLKPRLKLQLAEA